MPVIHVNVWEGFEPQKVRKAIEGIAQVFVHLGMPRHAVEVVVQEIFRSYWGIGGQPAVERSAGSPEPEPEARVQEAGAKKPVAGAEEPCA
jgi:4-oxalocrotonate tautomerase